MKGRLTDESDIPTLIELLRRNDCLLEIVGIDLNAHTALDVDSHKFELARVMLAGTSSAHHPNVHQLVNDLARRITSLPNQLYVQSSVLIELMRNTCENAVNYYAQRQPRELSAFHWVIDGKSKTGLTEGENLWASIVMPLLMAKSVEQPMALFEGGDFSFFDKFNRPPPSWLPIPIGATDTVTDIKQLLMEDFRYSSSIEPGLELVDVLVNAARRALIGHLDSHGWSTLPSLMIHRHQQYINLVKLHDRATEINAALAEILRFFTRGGRQMLAPRYRS